MKSLILKDLYNIGHNVRSLLISFAIMAVAFIPTSNLAGFIVMCAVVCSMWISTTFAFDDYSKWTRYAMIMPVSRKDLVVGKFIVLAIFSVIGSGLGFVVSFIATLAIGKITFDPAEILELLLVSIAALAISLIIGSISIPLMFKFGAEKARLLLMVSILIPMIICFGIYRLFGLYFEGLSDQLVITLLCCSPIFALIWCYVMYQISYRIFVKKEL